MRAVRQFFETHSILEVETPILSRCGTVDPAIDSFQTTDHWWLQTSPEFAMKRLLAAGSGPIYQIARVFRIDEAGRHHNPEFTLLEWYRPAFGYHRLMDEVEALLRVVGVDSPSSFPRTTYRAAFRRHAGIDPFEATAEQLVSACRQRLGDLPDPPALPAALLRDWYCDLLMSHAVGPALGRGPPEFLIDFPASQAALARIRPDHPPVAERFELFWNGIELANGFQELTDAVEQRARFERDRRQRLASGRAPPPIDTHLLSALAHGLPDCAGVALGIDRLLMQLLGRSRLAEVLSFDAERA